MLGIFSCTSNHDATLDLFMVWALSVTWYFCRQRELLLILYTDILISDKCMLREEVGTCMLLYYLPVVKVLWQCWMHFPGLCMFMHACVVYPALFLIVKVNFYFVPISALTKRLWKSFSSWVTLLKSTDKLTHSSRFGEFFWAAVHAQ